MPKKILTKLYNLDIIIAGIVLGVLILYTFIAVIMRYFINRPIYWGEEFQLICIITIVFFGAGAGFRTGSHIAIDFLVDFFPLKLQKIITVFIYLISVAVMVYFFIQSSAFVRQMFNTRRITDILRIPFFVIYSSFPIGCALIIINYTIVTYTKYFKGGNKEEPK
jgi:TRAP-type C4-dicarboxylate transport system permease small subunit